MKQPLLRLAFFFLLFTTCCHGQQFSLSNHIRDLNLPTQEIYKVIQDKKGYLWFATEFGLYRYQQGSATPIRTTAPSSHTAIMSICETKGGIINFATIQGKVFFVQKDSAIEFPFSKKGFFHYTNEIIYHIFEDEKQQLFIQTTIGTYRVSPDRLTTAQITPAPSDAFPVVLHEKRMLPINQHFKDHPKMFDNRVDPFVISFPDLTGEKIVIKKWPDALDHFRVLTAKWKDIHAVSYGRTLLLITDKGNISKIELPAHIIALRASPDTGLWIGLYKHGYYYFPDISSLKKPVTGLANISISDICIDREGGIWMTSLERGVFFSPGTFLLQHTYESQEPTPYKSLFVSEKGILAAARSKPTILISDNGMIQPVRQRNGDELDILIAYVETKQSRYFFNNMDIISQHRSTRQEQKKIAHNETFTSAVYLNKSSFLAFSPGNTILYSDTGIQILPRATERIYHSLAIGDGSVLAGSRTSTYYIADPSNPSFKKIPGDNGRVVQLFKTTSGNTFALIQHKGLSVFKHDSLRTILPSSAGQMYYACLESRPGEIWIASNEGVWAFQEKEMLDHSRITAILLTDHTAYSFAKRNGRIYMATTTGVISMPADISEKKEAGFPIYLQSWRAGDKELSFKDTSSLATFGYNEGSLNWVFDIASFRTQPATLHYALEGPQADSGVINGQHLQLGNLRPGKYNLEVWATRNDGVRSNSFTQAFRISPPYWQKTWFLVGLFTIIILALAILAWLIIRRMRHRENQKRKMESELLSIRLQALQAQMNPHFVFNAINSIQLFILEHKEQEAYHYLTQFSKLIRRVLIQSRSPLISLSDELETLRLYVGLEQLRFPDQFDYTIQADLLPDAARVYLPVMLLQPVIENAIVHGIEDNGAQGKISLHITHQSTEGVISFSIQDNGAGKRKGKTKAAPKPGHESASSVINAERIAALNKIYNTDKFSLMIQSPSTEILSGTIVTISIPDNLNADA